jgi:hypothetical protein
MRGWCRVFEFAVKAQEAEGEAGGWWLAQAGALARGGRALQLDVAGWETGR